MDHDARVAFVHAQTVCAMAALMGMQASNTDAILRGEPTPYNEGDFQSVPDQYGIGHNAVVTYLSGN